jgi:hypothetical protein
VRWARHCEKIAIVGVRDRGRNGIINEVVSYWTHIERIIDLPLVEMRWEVQMRTRACCRDRRFQERRTIIRNFLA